MALTTPTGPTTPTAGARRATTLLRWSGGTLLALAVASFVALWVPVVQLGDARLALVDPWFHGSPVAYRVAPRVVAIAALALGGAWAALGPRRGRLVAWFGAAGAAGALAALDLVWASDIHRLLTDPAGLPGRTLVGYRVQLLVVGLLGAAVLAGAVGAALELRGAPLPHRRRGALPGALVLLALSTAAVVLLDDTSFFLGSPGLHPHAYRPAAPLADVTVGVLLTVALAVVPALSLLARRRELSIGLGVGWLVVHVVARTQVEAAIRAFPPGLRLPATWTAGTVLTVVVGVGLVVWWATWDRAPGRSPEWVSPDS